MRINLTLFIFSLLAIYSNCWASEDVEKLCPGYVEWQNSHPSQDEAISPGRKISKPKLREKLLHMAERDQSVRSGDISERLNMYNVDKENYLEISKIVSDSGFPTEAEVGRDGVRAAWLLIQHASMDPALQSKVLQEIEPRVKVGEISGEHFALLYDRVAVLFHHEKQKYGTQLYPGAREATPLPIDRPEGVDERRAALGMMPLKDYLCIATVLRK